MSDLQDILSACYKNTELAAKTFLPDRFHRAFDKQLHGPIFDLLDNSDNPRKVIAAPRGTGKTSIINLLVPFTRIIYGDSNYIVPVSATTTLAVQQSENLKYELFNNDSVKALFGPLESGMLTKQQWIVSPLGEAICVMPRGAGQQIRGLLYRNHRPNLILVDDLEDPEHMDSEEQRAKKKEWFFGDLLNSVDRGVGSNWEVIVLGTVLHQNALLVDLLDDPSWDSVTLEICDDNLESKAPNFIPTAEVKKIYNEYKAQGQLDVFYRDYRNDPVPKGEDATFPQKFFRYYDPDKTELDRNKDVETFIIVDPAKTTNPKSAHSAIVGVSVNLRSNAIYVRDIVDAKLHPNELYDEIISMIQRIGAKVLGIEVTSLNEFITYPLKNELIRRGVHIEMIELHARGGDNEKGKEKRIKSLIPLYRSGLVYHNSSCCASLEAQLMSFPKSKRKDVMDAFGYTPEILEIGSRYMMQGDDDEEDSYASVEKEYAELEDDGYDDPYTDFRIV